MTLDQNKKTSAEKSIVWPLWVGGIFLIVISLAWIMQPPSREEGFGDTVKLWDMFRAGIGGWTPNYLMGHSPVLLHVILCGELLGAFAVQAFGSIVGALTASKLLVVGYIAASGWAMHLLLMRLKTGRSIALLGSLLYIILPTINVRLGIYEHFGVGLCFVFTPLILRGIVAVAEEGSPREIVALGLSAAALALSYTKIAIVMSPMLLLWAGEVLRQNRSEARRVVMGYGWSLLVAALAAIPFLVPSFREFGFAAGFLFDPLDAWKHHYAFKTPLLWIDLWGFLTQGNPELMGDAQMFQIGLIPLVALTISLLLSSLAEFRASQLGRWFLILTGCWLLSIWLASGPDGILMGHFHVLKTSQALPDTSIPLLWLSLIWIGWLVYITTVQLVSGTRWIAALITILFLVVPVFRIAEFLPLFNDVRAPESYWSVGGFCCLVAAVSISFWIIFTEVISEGWRKPAAWIVACIMLVELYPIHSAYWTRGMEPQLFTEFDQAAAFLKTAPLQGRVHPLSGRYFYLTLPQKSGRALDTEAAWRHFQLKWVRHLEAAGNAGGDAIKTYDDLAGVAYILIDKKDPFTPKQVQDFYRSIYPVAFENNYFAVLANPGTLYPAFLAHDFVALPMESYAMAPAALQLFPRNLVTVEMAAVEQNMPGFAGRANGTNQIALLPQYQSQNGQPFARVPLAGNRMDDYQKMTYQLPPTVSGWLVVSEAYHPDWTVTIDGRPAEVHRADAALLSTFVPLGSHEVIFQFQEPAWYLMCLAVGALAWLISLVALFYLPSKNSPDQWRDWWIGKINAK
jgi:hypothetical protein